MDFRRIQHFINVAELGSLSKAAERLNIVQPALSQSIKRLEDDLGVQLFTRSRKGMELTRSGRTFVKHAYGILNQYNRAKESLSDQGENPKGRVSIAITASALEVLTVPLATHLIATYPDIKLNVESGLAANIQQGFEAGQYDLVISHLVKAGERIQIENLIEEDLFLVTPYDSDNMGEDIEFSRLHQNPLIIPQDQHGVAPNIERFAEEKGIEITYANITGAMHSTMQLVEAGFGNSILPWSAIYERVQKNAISARKIVNPSLHHMISMIYPTHRPLTPASVAVMGLIRTVAKEVHNKGNWSGTLLTNAE